MNCIGANYRGVAVWAVAVVRCVKTAQIVVNGVPAFPVTPVSVTSLHPSVPPLTASAVKSQ